MQSASAALVNKSREYTTILERLREARTTLERRQREYDRATLWQFGGGVTTFAGIAAGGRALTGWGPSLAYRPNVSLELNVLIRWDALDGELSGPSGRGLMGFTDGPWGFFAGIGASQTGTSALFPNGQLALVLPLSLRYRFGHELRCVPVIPVFDLSILAEPWITGSTPGPLKNHRCSSASPRP